MSKIYTNDSASFYDANVKKVKELKDENYSYSQIRNITGIAESTARDWIKKFESTDKSDDLHRKIFSVPDMNLTKGKVLKKEKQNEEILDFLARLTPVQFKGNEKVVKPLTKANDVALVIGDTHFGQEDWNTLNIFLEVVREIKPNKIILNGDILDMSYISKYPKDYRNTVSLNKERDQFHTFLNILFDITKDYQTEIVETEANHSGNGLASRWWRYLNDRIGEIISIPEVQEKLSYTSIFYPAGENNRLKLVDSVELVKNQLLVLHGDVVKGRGGMSAVANIDKWGISTICNHTHKIGMSSKTIPSIGDRKTRIIRAYENGCACDLNPSYVTAADWQNAFSIVHYTEKNFAVETVLVNGNQATVCALGKSIKV